MDDDATLSALVVLYRQALIEIAERRDCECAKIAGAALDGDEEVN